jgi:hypothetical protein
MLDFRIGSNQLSQERGHHAVRPEDHFVPQAGVTTPCFSAQHQVSLPVIPLPDLHAEAAY